MPTFKRPEYWSKEKNLDAYARQSGYIHSIQSEKERMKPKPAPRKYGPVDKYGVQRQIREPHGNE